MLNIVSQTFSYDNHELFCKQSVLLIKGVAPDILHIYIESGLWRQTHRNL